MKKLVSLAAIAASLVAAPAFAKTTPAQVDVWVKKADKAYFDESVKNGQTEWVYETYIMDDSAAIAADENAKMSVLQSNNAAKAAAEEAVKNAKSDVDMARARSELTILAAELSALRRYRAHK